jgi:hypothetical protein
MGAIFLIVVMQIFKNILKGIAPNESGLYMGLFFLLFSLFGLLINPFALTVMRLAAQDKINDTAASGGVIVSTGLILFYTSAMYLGTRR